MYNIVNYDAFTRYQHTFATFKDAWMMHQLLGDEHAVIETYTDGNIEVVWKKEYEEVMLDGPIPNRCSAGRDGHPIQ